MRTKSGKRQQLKLLGKASRIRMWAESDSWLRALGAEILNARG